MKKKILYTIEIVLIIILLIVAYENIYKDVWDFSTERLITKAVKMDDGIVKPTRTENGLSYTVTYDEKSDISSQNIFNLFFSFTPKDSDRIYSYSVSNDKAIYEKLLNSIQIKTGITKSDLKKKVYLTLPLTVNWMKNDLFYYLGYNDRGESNSIPNEEEVLKLPQTFQLTGLKESDVSNFLGYVNIDNIVRTIKENSSFDYKKKELNYLVMKDSVDRVVVTVKFNTPKNAETYISISSNKVSDKVYTKINLISNSKLTLIPTKGLKGELYVDKEYPYNSFKSSVYYFVDDYYYSFSMLDKGDMTEKEYIKLIEENLK